MTIHRNYSPDMNSSKKKKLASVPFKFIDIMGNLWHRFQNIDMKQRTISGGAVL
jgi:hypothetical protein